jgi:S-adenosylmethionine synthetase
MPKITVFDVVVGAGKLIVPKRENKKGRTYGGVLPEKRGIEIQGSAGKNQFRSIECPYGLISVIMANSQIEKFNTRDRWTHLKSAIKPESPKALGKPGGFFY